MKFQINTESKTIKLESSNKIGELVKWLQKCLPDWEEYTLECNVIIKWRDPIIVERDDNPFVHPYKKRQQSWPWNTPMYSSSGVEYAGKLDYPENKKVFSIELM